MTRRRMNRSGARARRTAVVLAALALVVGAVSLGAGPVAAASTGDLVGTGRGTDITGTIDGGSSQAFWAGELRVRIDDGVEVVAWCIDLGTSIDVESGDDLREVDWATSGIADLDRVSYVLNAVTADADELPGTVDQRAAAIQAAIWHLTDRFDLDRTANAAEVVAGYDAVLSAVPAEGLPVEPAPSLAVTPATITVVAGGVAGPFTVSTTAAEVRLDVAAGVDVVDWDTGEALSLVVDGTRFGVRAVTAGDVTLTASATATVHAGRVFARLDDEGRPVVQRLILGTTSEAGTSATVTARFDPPTTTTVPETTTTTVPGTTTTTVPETTTTTVPGTTTTTVPETTTTTVPAEVLGITVERAELARTGRPSGEVATVGLVAVLTGVVLVVTTRRRAAR